MRWIVRSTGVCPKVPVQLSYVRPLRCTIALEEGQIAKDVAGNELVTGRREIRRTINPPPRTRIKIDLVQHITLGMAGVQRYDLRQVRVAVRGVLGAAIAEIGLGYGMPRPGIAVGARIDRIHSAVDAVQP